MHRGGGVAAIAGAVTLVAGTALHPMSADANDPLAAFAEYAADRLWIASHLTQFPGVALLALQAVDGIALKVMVDRWAASSGEGRALAFEGAFAVQAYTGLSQPAMLLTMSASSLLLVWAVALGIAMRRLVPGPGTS